MGGLINRELFRVIIRGRARTSRNLKDFIGHEDSPNEDMVKAAHNSRRVRYPGELDAPKKRDYQSESLGYNCEN